MKARSVVMLPATLTLALGTTAAASEWKIDSHNTTADFAIRHMMVNTVKGHFGKVEGTVDLDEKDATKSKVDVSIDASTIDTREPMRDNHLKSPDFFDVAKYPTLTFKSTKIEKAGKSKFKVTGDLTMHGVTKPVVLEIDGPTPAVKNPMGQMTRGASVTGKINRKEWGLNWNKALEAGGVLVGEEVKIEINAELTQAGAPAQAATGGKTTGNQTGKLTPAAATAPAPAPSKK